MLFDVQAALADILSAPGCDTRDIRDMAAPVSQLSRVSQGGGVLNKPERAPQPAPADDPYRYGRSVVGGPKTWTGRVVSLDQWRRLSDWEKRGPNGRHWCGIARDWIDPKGK